MLYCQKVDTLYFYSRTSCEVQPATKIDLKITPQFLLTHLLRGATLNAEVTTETSAISTHAPLARCNPWFSICSTIRLYFYSRTSCEVQPLDTGIDTDNLTFLLTHLLRGATMSRVRKADYELNFYSRTSCEVQHLVILPESGHLIFLLTHLLRGATFSLFSKKSGISFLLMHLLRGATVWCMKLSSLVQISTHAPLARCN